VRGYMHFHSGTTDRKLPNRRRNPWALYLQVVDGGSTMWSGKAITGPMDV
jgi:hypothetical protein